MCMVAFVKIFIDIFCDVYISTLAKTAENIYSKDSSAISSFTRIKFVTQYVLP